MATSRKTNGMDAISMLMAVHRRIESLFNRKDRLVTGGKTQARICEKPKSRMPFPSWKPNTIPEAR